VLNLSLWIIFLLFKWTNIKKGLGHWFNKVRLVKGLNTSPRPLNPYYVAISMFTCNFIGIVCARSLHYQFYSWYFHQLPLLLFSITYIHTTVKLLIFFTIEYCWNVFPPRSRVSLVLFNLHVMILVGLFFVGKLPSSPYLSHSELPSNKHKVTKTPLASSSTE